MARKVTPNNTRLDGVGKTDRKSISPRVSNAHQSTDKKAAQDFRLIWLDQAIHPKNSEYEKTMNGFGRLKDSIEVVIDPGKCIQLIENSPDQKIHLITSGSLGRKVIPHLHDLSQMKSIFIFCGDKTLHEQWAKNIPKLKGIHTDIKELYQGLERAINPNMNSSTADENNHSLPDSHLSFIYTSILKEILLSTTSEEDEFQELAKYFRTQYPDDQKRLGFIEKFQREYDKQTVVQWYTNEDFLRSMVDRALEMMDINILIRMGFYLRDLHQAIEHHRDYSDTKLTVYHAECISRTHFERLKKNQNDLIFFNRFLLTSKDPLQSFHPTQKQRDTINVLYIMNVNTSKSFVPCTSNKHQVLFSMHTIFHVDRVEPRKSQSDLVEIHLTLVNVLHDDLRIQIDDLREEVHRIPHGWPQIAYLMTKFDQEDQTYEFVLSRISNKLEQANIHQRIGLNAVKRNDYKKALHHYEKAIGLWQKNSLPNDLRLATLCKEIGLVYHQMKRPDEASKWYEDALEIYRNILPPNHPDFLSIYDNLGLVYNELGNDLDALLYYEKAMGIRKRTLRFDHPDLAASYDTIGSVYRNLKDVHQTVFFYQIAVKKAQIMSPANESTLAKYEKHLEAANKPSSHSN